MNIDENLLIAMSEETNVSINHIKRYYDLLIEMPFVLNGTKEQLLNCLYLLINIRKIRPERFGTNDFYYNLNDAVKAVYKIELSNDYMMEDLFYFDKNPSKTLKKPQ